MICNKANAMQQYELISPTDEALHATEAELLERRVMELALERTGSRNGAIFLWDHKANGLAIQASAASLISTKRTC